MFAICCLGTPSHFIYLDKHMLCGILVIELRHSPEKVWQALTDLALLREWAPFEADGSLGTVGMVKLAWVGAPEAYRRDTKIFVKPDRASAFDNQDALGL